MNTMRLPLTIEPWRYLQPRLLPGSRWNRLDCRIKDNYSPRMPLPDLQWLRHDFRRPAF